ncbi:MAG: hypothetical protein ACOYN4_17135 [Bacteroidales bacterium]
MTFIKKVVIKPEGVTYGDILDRFAKLRDVKNLTGDKLCFARSKNLMHLRTFEKLNGHVARIPFTSDFEKYQKEFSELRGNYLLTDSMGKAVLHNGDPTVDIANPELVSKIEALNLIYKGAIQERENDVKAYNCFLQEAVPEDELPKIHTVKIEDASGLSQDQVDAIIWFVIE